MFNDYNAYFDDDGVLIAIPIAVAGIIAVTIIVKM